jgi:hypothetical protein
MTNHIYFIGNLHRINYIRGNNIYRSDYSEEVQFRSTHNQNNLTKMTFYMGALL